MIQAINVIVELIDDADAAFDIVKTALQNGKAVVSANKKMIAEHFEELLAIAGKIPNTIFIRSLLLRQYAHHPQPGRIL